MPAFRQTGEAAEGQLLDLTARGPQKVISRRFSVTVRLGKMPRPSGMVHSPARDSASGRMPLTWRPSTWKQPFVGTICPLATLSVVDFPAPLGPSRASTSPVETARSMPCSTSIWP